MTPVIWLPEAEDDLSDIVDYIAQDNPAAALRVHGRIREAVHLLADYPFAGPTGHVPGTRELSVLTRYFVVYKVKFERVEVVGVIHTSRNYP